MFQVPQIVNFKVSSSFENPDLLIKGLANFEEITRAGYQLVWLAMGNKFMPALATDLSD